VSPSLEGQSGYRSFCEMKYQEYELRSVYVSAASGIEGKGFKDLN
jgi:hypothetical protein